MGGGELQPAGSSGGVAERCGGRRLGGEAVYGGRVATWAAAAAVGELLTVPLRTAGGLASADADAAACQGNSRPSQEPLPPLAASDSGACAAVATCARGWAGGTVGHPS